MEMIEVKTAELIGPALDWATAKASGTKIDDSRGNELRIDIAPGFQSPWVPSVNWYQGGPLIEKFILDLKFCVFELPNESWKAETHESWANGSTALIASMRAIVHANFGDAVSVPKELMQ